MNKNQIKAAVSTAIITGLIFIFLIFCGMSLTKEDMDEGVMVSLGETMEGFGQQTPNPVVPEKTAPQPVTPSAPIATPVKTEPLKTQVDESVALEQERKRKHEQEVRQQQEEQRRIEEQRKAEQLERDKKAQAAKNLASGAFSKKTGQGSGTSTGDAMKGNPAGHGSQGGHSWSLSGRDLLGKLAQPVYSSDQEGTIVVDIRVDETGAVVQATIGTGTTITSESLRKASLESARKTKFSQGKGVAIGKITYHFVLR